MSCRVGSSNTPGHGTNSHGGCGPPPPAVHNKTPDEWDIDEGGSGSRGYGSGGTAGANDAGGTGGTGGTGSSGGPGFNAGPNTGLKPWTKGINDASYISGLDPNLIGGQMWAESRGRPDTVTTNIDGTSDVGLMQISQERWLRDILPNLTAEQRRRIKERTGKDASELNMNNPQENIIGGALELENWIRQKGSVDAALKFYVSGGVPGVGSPTYVTDVLNFRDILSKGGTLPP